MQNSNTIRAQIDAHVKNGRRGSLFRADFNTDDAAKLSKHAPNTWAVYNSGGDWNAVAAAIGVDLERLHNAKFNAKTLSAEGQDTLDTLGELRHVVMQNVAIERSLHSGTATAFVAAGGRASPETWIDNEGRPVAVYGPNEPIAQRSSGGQPGLGDVVRALVTGRGVREIRDALGEGSIGTGGALVPSPLAGNVIDRMRARMVTVQAGARTVPLPNSTLAIARITADPTVSWAAEAASIAEGGPTFDRVTFTAKTLRAWVKISRELAEDAANLDEAVTQSFAGAMALEFDRAALVGSGTGAEPRGIGNATSAAPITSMGTNGAQLTNWDNVITVWQALLDANANDPTAMVMAPRTAGTIAKLKDTTNQPLQVPPALAGIPRLVTTSMPTTQSQGTSNLASTLIIGDWSQLLLGVRSELQIVKSDGAFMQTNEIGLLFVMRADVQWTNAAQFAQLRGIIP